MGILFVLLFWGMLGSVVAVVGGFIARRITVAVTPTKLTVPTDQLVKKLFGLRRSCLLLVLRAKPDTSQTPGMQSATVQFP